MIIINTKAGRSTTKSNKLEISVPGFLQLEPNRQFRVEGPLGSGGSATVFRAVVLDRDLVAQHGVQYVAVKKVVPSPKISAEQNKERFLQEISMMWSCTFHQNVIKLIGYTLEPELCIITKLYEIDLYTLIHHPQEQISSLLALKLSCDIAAAMNYCQEVGIVHRDLKSANVLLEQVPFNQHEFILKAVVCDFGLARVTNSVNTIESMKIHDIGGFSPRYAAPEVLINFKMNISADPEVDKKSDVYSYSIIIWELLTRRVPWEGFTHDQIEENVCKGSRLPVLPNDGTDQPRTILIDLMKSCWAHPPAQRPSFNQIYTSLSGLL